MGRGQPPQNFNYEQFSEENRPIFINRTLLAMMIKKMVKKEYKVYPLRSVQNERP
jgi:hypothetical protein